MKNTLRTDIARAALTLANDKTTFQIAAVMDAIDNRASRQYVHSVLKELIADNKLISGGAGRASVYALPEHINLVSKHVTKRLINKKLEEHIVFDKFKQEASFLQSLPENVFSIVDYTFQEMLNNAIDHSESTTITVSAKKEDRSVVMKVDDTGIGAFANIAKKLHLSSEIQAIGELMKGKTTTAPKNHTGEGIFFSSKAVDIFVLDSHKHRLTVNNLIQDVFIEDLKQYKKGTRVKLRINQDSQRHLSDIFRKHQMNPDDHAFNQTQIIIKLFEVDTVYMSRSQARRIMSGLGEKFKKIILDFEDVQTIGQAFADEIFRVFQNKYKSAEIVPINAKDGVQFMIDRALASQL